jgi:hypothetical protein
LVEPHVRPHPVLFLTSDELANEEALLLSVLGFHKHFQQKMQKMFFKQALLTLPNQVPTFAVPTFFTLQFRFKL